MFTNWDTVIAAIGLLFVETGIYLWFGIEPAFILFGLILIYVGMKINIVPAKGDNNESDQTTNT